MIEAFMYKGQTLKALEKKIPCSRPMLATVAGIFGDW
jgi:hypothetical protein